MHCFPFILSLAEHCSNFVAAAFSSPQPAPRCVAPARQCGPRVITCPSPPNPPSLVSPPKLPAPHLKVLPTHPPTPTRCRYLQLTVVSNALQPHPAACDDGKAAGPSSPCRNNMSTTCFADAGDGQRAELGLELGGDHSALGGELPCSQPQPFPPQTLQGRAGGVDQGPPGPQALYGAAGQQPAAGGGREDDGGRLASTSVQVRAFTVLSARPCAPRVAGRLPQFQA
jgi:hypothetical protein